MHAYSNVLDPGVVVVSIVTISLSTLVALITLIQRGRERRRRLDLIESALNNPSLSPESHRELVHQLQPPRARWSIAVGWFGLIGGISWLCTEPRGDEFYAAVVCTAFAFGLLTLPLVVRELESRRA